MLDHAPTVHLQRIRNALNIQTQELPRCEREAVWKLSQQLANRLACELWADKLGWRIPPYGTPEWQEMFEAWTESEGE